jgi:tetratricopeptide (TPR) repeat protein
MLPLPEGRVFLRWMYLALGLGILCFPEFTVQAVLRAPHWAGRFYPEGSRAYAQFVAAGYVYARAVPLGCVAAFLGLWRNRSWSRWTGAAAFGLLLPGFPLLSVAGAVGLYAMFAKPLAADPRSRPAAPSPANSAAGRWSPGRDSMAQPFTIGIGMIFGFQGLAFLTLYAQRNGMPAWNPGIAWLAFFLLSLLAHAALHELGHVAAAWTVFFRVRSVMIGPFVFQSDAYGYRFRLDWKRLLDSGGYTGAAPVTGGDLIVKLAVVIAGGPLLSLLAGGLCLLAFLALPGTGWEGAWLIVAFNAVLGVSYAGMSLLPMGCSDGAMLYHLLRDTPAGRQLIGRIKVPLVQEQAEAAHSRADFQQEVEFRTVALRQAQTGGGRDSTAIALGHQDLGHALLALEDWPRAQAEFLKCLGFETECALNPSLKANSWWGLQEACARRHWAQAAAHAGAAAVKAIGECQPARNPAGLAVTRIMLAQARLRAGEYQTALTEAAAALAILPRRDGHLMLRAAIFSVEAQAHLLLGAERHGIVAAREAAAILNSPGIPEPNRNLAFDELGELGEGLWDAGQSGTGIDLMRQAVTQLESGGAMATAAQYRIKLAAALRTLGRHSEALYTLPAEETLPPGALGCLLGVRAAIHLAAGHPRDAATDARALLNLWLARAANSESRAPLDLMQPQPPAAIEIARAEALLAHACLEAGNPAEAEPLARHAAGVLAEWGHPDAAGCRITLALATRERSRAVFEAALRLIESAPLTSAAEKARRREAERARVDRFGPVEGSITVEIPVQLAGD